MKFEFNHLEKSVLDSLSKKGRVYLIGGIVRDMVMYQKVDYHDVDVEIYDLEIDEIIDILSQYGKVNEVGKSFGILKLDCLPNFDFALPRIERKKGQTHREFEVEVHKDLDMKTACCRRDFTINAMMYDYQNGKLIDYYQGREDIKNKCLKMVDEKTFYEDPLRVLRLAQFMSRFEFQVDLKTKEICQKMVNEGVLQYLSLERIQQEYNKLLMSSHPSMGLKFLLELNALIRPLETLVTCPQRLDFHPEGNVMNHTLLVVDLAALCKDKTSWPLAFMWSALLHDIGKPLVTTPEGKAPGHNESGVKVFNQYFSHFFTNKKMKKYIRTMIYYHMHLMNMVRNQSKDYSYYKLLKGIEGIFPLNDLVCMSKCDKLGRLANRPETISTLDTYVEEKVSRCGNHALKPFVDGKLLIELGFKPNQDFKELLDWAYDLQMRGHDKESVIQLLKGRKDGR